jgi:uncharacterized glyoxalase superfamily protein PhnB
MVQTTTTDTQVFYPAHRYRDAAAAIEWLEKAFGFERKEVHQDDDGTIVHAELMFGPGVVMLGSERDDRYGPHAGHGWTYVVVDDPDALFVRASAMGAEVVQELIDTDYGSRDFSVRDPEGTSGASVPTARLDRAEARRAPRHAARPGATSATR